jgi:hypothetical protein
MAEPLKFCKYCESWKSPDAARRGESIGLCDNIMVALKVQVEVNDKSNSKNKGVFTRGNFGCIYWREGNLRRTPIL